MFPTNQPIHVNQLDKKTIRNKLPTKTGESVDSPVVQLLVEFVGTKANTDCEETSNIGSTGALLSV